MQKIKKLIAKNRYLMRLFARLRGWDTCESYALFVPPYINVANPNPLIVALHGKRGTIYEFVFTDLAKIAQEYGYVIACPGGRGGIFYNSEGEQDVLNVIKEVKNKYNIDQKRIYLLGASMGARGAIYIGCRNSHLFAGIATIYGVADDMELMLINQNTARIPFFVTHGTKDMVIPIEQSKKLIERLKSVGCKYRFDFVDGLGHDLKVLNISLPEIIVFFNDMLKMKLSKFESNHI